MLSGHEEVGCGEKGIPHRMENLIGRDRFLKRYEVRRA